MQKRILITGSTDGIGLESARRLVAQGHQLLLHGRNRARLDELLEQLSALPGAGPVEGYLADLSDLPQVDQLADEIARRHDRLDVLINNAGVFKATNPLADSGLDLRFRVNTLAPYRLTRRLLPLMDRGGRVINLSSAAQAPVDLQALAGQRQLGDDFQAYAQSKLAITQWSFQLARELGEQGPAIIAVNPGSLLGTKMVKQGFGMAGKDIGIGADILVRLALDDEFADASGRYFDNDAGHFGQPHPDALDSTRRTELLRVMDQLLG